MAPSRARAEEPSDQDSGNEDFPSPAPKRRRVSPPREDEANISEENQLPAFPQSATTLSRVRRTVDDARRPSNSTAGPTESIPAASTSTFASLSVSPWLVHSLAAMAIKNPTDIQRACIPQILAGRDCIGGSRTGTGKTVAFAVPILQKWAEDPFGTYAVVLTPTRELALQIFEQFQALGTPQNLKTVLITGGVDMRPQALALAARPHIVVATPGRLADHILTSGKETTVGLSRAKVVVFDEADRLLAPGSGSMLPDINTCLSAVPPSPSRLTLLFTATVTPEVRALKDAPRPKDRLPIFVSEIADPDDPSSFSPSTSTSLTTNTTKSLLPPTLSQTYLQVPMTHKDAFLHVLLSVPSFTQPPAGSSSPAPPSIIIFTNRTSTADLLHRTLLLLSHPVTSLHSALPQTQRARNLSDFRSQKSRILIATDVASRGLDIPDVRVVVNYDVPRNPTDYVHRVGRTARAGREGTSVTFVGQRDVSLVLAIEEYVGGGGMVEWGEEGVNVETRVVRGRTLKDVAEARMEALRDVEGGKDVTGWRRRIKKDTSRGGSK
ncbi:putative RNA helicase [Exophiala bonariae]|uniref:RNA helicase n=1 Tax=Exophiala bonariae TaxID=1690606 RepID=A0AAV9MYP1_9EURO|nr:putative RNA helicase [Exophiala bonariae]